MPAQYFADMSLGEGTNPLFYGEGVWQGPGYYNVPEGGAWGSASYVGPNQSSALDALGTGVRYMNANEWAGAAAGRPAGWYEFTEEGDPTYLGAQPMTQRQQIMNTLSGTPQWYNENTGALQNYGDISAEQYLGGGYRPWQDISFANVMPQALQFMGDGQKSFVPGSVDPALLSYFENKYGGNLDQAAARAVFQESQGYGDPMNFVNWANPGGIGIYDDRAYNDMFLPLMQYAGATADPRWGELSGMFQRNISQSHDADQAAEDALDAEFNKSVMQGLMAVGGVMGAGALGAFGTGGIGFASPAYSGMAGMESVLGGMAGVEGAAAGAGAAAAGSGGIAGMGTGMNVPGAAIDASVVGSAVSPEAMAAAGAYPLSGNTVFTSLPTFTGGNMLDALNPNIGDFPTGGGEAGSGGGTSNAGSGALDNLNPNIGDLPTGGGSAEQPWYERMLGNLQSQWEKDPFGTALKGLTTLGQLGTAFSSGSGQPTGNTGGASGTGTGGAAAGLPPKNYGALNRAYQAPNNWYTYAYRPEHQFFTGNALPGNKRGGAIRRYAEGGGAKREITRLRKQGSRGALALADLRALRGFEAAEEVPPERGYHTDELTEPLEAILARRGAPAMAPRGGALDAIPAHYNQLEGLLEQLRMQKRASGGQADDVPAMLSEGEYVFDADVVSALGDGNNDAGAALLDEMRENVRAHKRAAPDSKIPPKARRPEQYLPKGALRRRTIEHGS